MSESSIKHALEAWLAEDFSIAEVEDGTVEMVRTFVLALLARAEIEAIEGEWLIRSPRHLWSAAEHTAMKARVRAKYGVTEDERDD